MVRVTWTSSALDDLKGIREFIKRDSEFQAKRVCMLIKEKTKMLRRSPEIGVVVPELNDTTIRELKMFNYRIIYRYVSNKEKADILAVIHGARQIGETNEG